MKHISLSAHQRADAPRQGISCYHHILIGQIEENKIHELVTGPPRAKRNPIFQHRTKVVGSEEVTETGIQGFAR
jgi:hypothetical protein